MNPIGTEEHPLRVAVIGAGPAGFYAAGHLLKQSNLVVTVDMYDRLPTPFGLVRCGVAPDHQNIKNVTRVFDKTAADPRFRFFGNVHIGRDVGIDVLRAHYHQIVYATGAQTDRNLDIPGEDLAGSHSATEFVAWYNGHPDFRDLTFDLSQESVAIVGVGNVAVDVARILCRTPEELAKTDIADYALEALRASRVREVYMLGRRGPAQAAFTNPEIKELGELEDADVIALPEEVALDPLSQAALDRDPDRPTLNKIEILKGYGQQQPTGKSKRLILRFLVSPVELIGDDAGHVAAMRIVRNRLYETEDGRLRPEATDEYEELPVGLVFRSIGYTGVPLPDVPFHERWGVIPNEQGRVIDPETKEPRLGEYATGWIKRGATGVIGTNKADAVETVNGMLEDVEQGRVLDPSYPEPEAAETMIQAQQPHFFSYADWRRIDELETTRGADTGRPRVKLTCIEDMLTALEQASTQTETD